jgi:hypothetical protein
LKKESRGMTDQQFIIDLGNEQRAVVEPDDAAWLQEKLRREPGSTRVELRYDDNDVEGHGGSNPRFKVVLEGDDDTEGHAMTLNFPTREEADAFRKRLMLTGVLAGTIVLGAAGGIGLANMSNDAATLGAASTAVSGSDWSQVERPAAADAGTAGSAWTVDERPDYAALGAAGAADAGGASSATDRPDYAALGAAGAAATDDDSSSTDADAPTLGGPTPR